MVAPLVFALLALSAQQTDTTVSVRPNARLELENDFGGSIAVKTWDRNQVRVQASHGRRDEVRVSANTSVVRIEAEGRVGPARVVDYVLTVPRSMSLDLSGTNTSIDIDGVQGEIEAETVQGDVSVSGGSGRIRLESVQGQILLSNARGRIDVSTVNRGIHLVDVVGDVTAETVNGAIVLDRVQATTVDAATVNGLIVYNGTIRDRGNYMLSTHNGGIWVIVPEGTNATVNVSTFNGELDSSFNVALKQTTNRREFSFVLGNGSAQLDLETFGGDVRLRRPGESRPGFPASVRSR
ncbi:MAG TPA: DUF4097 family beta strand repeat-containing protein [Longimicrobiales bacterium]|nr:DUF4097 family beta strand repeat-containing protein [Longimicrobiales bacterium]